MDNQAEIDKLLKMYDEYKNVAEKITKIEPKIAKKKILNQNHDEESKKIAELQSELQRISDAMTFANPIVWIGYKYAAYRGEPQPITTLRDLVIHCSKPDYICTKRFNFLNSYLENHEMMAIDKNPNLAMDDDLAKILASEELQKIAGDEDFMQKWREFEYFKDGERVAKWENFKE